MISFDEVFSSVKQYCREKGAIPDVAVKLWINALHPVRLDGNVALFTVQSSFQRDALFIISIYYAYTTFTLSIHQAT